MMNEWNFAFNAIDWISLYFSRKNEWNEPIPDLRQTRGREKYSLSNLVF